jgi:hypothetical protein
MKRIALPWILLAGTAMSQDSGYFVSLGARNAKDVYLYASRAANKPPLGGVITLEGLDDTKWTVTSVEHDTAVRLSVVGSDGHGLEDNELGFDDGLRKAKQEGKWSLVSSTTEDQCDGDCNVADITKTEGHVISCGRQLVFDAKGYTRAGTGWQLTRFMIAYAIAASSNRTLVFESDESIETVPLSDLVAQGKCPVATIVKDCTMMRGHSPPKFPEGCNAYGEAPSPIDLSEPAVKIDGGYAEMHFRRVLLEGKMIRDHVLKHVCHPKQSVQLRSLCLRFGFPIEESPAESATIAKLLRKAAKSLFQFSGDINAAIEKYRATVTLDKPYHAIHVRRGDKLYEFKAKDKVESGYPLQSHFDVLKAKLGEPSEKITVFIATDDQTAVKEELTAELQEKFDCHFVTAGVAQKGHHQPEFNKRGAAERLEMVAQFLAELQTMANAEYVVGAMSSNVMVLLGLFFEGDHQHILDIQRRYTYKWHIMT